MYKATIDTLAQVLTLLFINVFYTALQFLAQHNTQILDSATQINDFFYPENINNLITTIGEVEKNTEDLIINSLQKRDKILSNTLKNLVLDIFLQTTACDSILKRKLNFSDFYSKQEFTRANAWAGLPPI